MTHLVFQIILLSCIIVHYKTTPFQTYGRTGIKCYRCPKELGIKCRARDAVIEECYYSDESIINFEDITPYLPMNTGFRCADFRYKYMTVTRGTQKVEGRGCVGDMPSYDIAKGLNTLHDLPSNTKWHFCDEDVCNSTNSIHLLNYTIVLIFGSIFLVMNF